MRRPGVISAEVDQINIVVLISAKVRTRCWVVAIASLSLGGAIVGGDLPHERIVYTTVRPANWELFVFDHDASSPKHGQPPRQLTDDPALDYDPTLSPDGRWVVFCSERSGNPDLYALDLEDPSKPRQLTRDPFLEAAPAFTPDGKSLLCVSDRNGNADIFVMPFSPNEPAGGVKATNLTKNASGDYRPAISPDGKTIAFSSDRDTWIETINDRKTAIRCEIYLMNIDGSNPRRLTNSNAFNGSAIFVRHNVIKLHDADVPTG